MIPKIIINYDKVSDATNRKNSLLDPQSIWWRLVNKNNFKTIKNIFLEENNLDKLISFIDRTYSEKDIQNNCKYIKKIVDENIEYIVNKLEIITGHPFDYKSITILWTTFPRCPYNWEDGILWTFALTNESQLILRNIIHELIHFQFHKYYTEYCKIKWLNETNFYTLKESLTFLVNVEFSDLEVAEDKWYIQHKETREQLKEYWLKNDKNFSDLVTYWCSILSLKTKE